MRGLRPGILLLSAACVLWAMPAAAVPKVVTLGTEESSSADPAVQCEALAAVPFERGTAGGLADDQVFLDDALAACEAAHAAEPESAEAETWLARVYALLGRADEAQTLLEDAAGRGSGVAAFLLFGLLDNSPGDGVDDDPDRALVLLRQSADFGYAPAALALGDLYEQGKAIGLDYVEARRLYHLASGQGLGMATYRLGRMAHFGYDTDPDFAQAMSLYQQAVAQGEPAGSFGIGQLYEYGEGVDQDYAKAAAAYQAGADRNEKMSQTGLASLYEQGLGVEKNLDTSFALVQAAAAQDYGYADALLALHYLLGEGTPVDGPKAFSLASTAVEKGVAYANGIIGYMLAEGLGVDRDLGAALTQFESGAEAGDQYSADRIPAIQTELACQDAAGSPYEPGGYGHGVEFEAIDADAAIAACQAALEVNPGSVGDGVWLAQALVKAGRIAEALPLLDPGVGAGNAFALTIYAGLLLEGTGLDADPARAVELYDQAAAKDFAPAALALGRLYAEGQVVPRDTERAAGYLRRASDAGMEAAQAELAQLADSGDGAAGSDLNIGFGEAGPAY